MYEIPNKLLYVLILLSCLTTGEGSAELRRFNILKFGSSSSDYIVYQPDMSPLASEFTVCAWIRKLGSASYPNWFSYSTPSEGKEVQITDNGSQFYMFGTQSDLRSVYTISPGTWFHNCLSWSSATQTRTVYINGRVVDSASTPAGRTLGQGGYLLFGNEQDTYGNYRTDADNGNKFEGEMYKLNVFSRMLTTSEIQKLAQNMCVNIEQEYESTRYIKWEDILQLSRNGNVGEKDSGCYGLADAIIITKLVRIELKLNETLVQQATDREKLRKAEIKLNSTSLELVAAKVNLNRSVEELANTRERLEEKEEKLNETIIQMETGKLELENTRETLNETISDKEAAKSELAKIRETLNETLSDKEAAKSELAKIRETLNETISDKEATKSELAKTRETLNETLREIEARLAQLKTTKEALNITLLVVESRNDDLRRTKERLTETETKLNKTLAKVEELEEVANTVSECPLNSTITSQFDFLYSDMFYQQELTTDKLGVVRRILDKLEHFVGVRLTDRVIEFFKLYLKFL